MKKLLAGVMALVFLAGAASAMSNIEAMVQNTGGKTKYSQTSMVRGMDWSEGQTWQVTGYIDECIDNDGSILIGAQVYNPAPWVMQEAKYVTGSGDTLIEKEVAVWTEDTTLWENAQDPWRNPNGAPGELAYPTEAWIDTMFNTAALHDVESVYFLMDTPDAAHGPGLIGSNNPNIGVFQKGILTDDPFIYEELVGIGICNDCPIPEVPGCEGPFCECPNGECTQ